MDTRRQQLQERIAAVQTEPASTRRYGAALKRAIVTYARERAAAGMTHDGIAAELGLSPSVLGKWRRHARRRWASGREPFARGQAPWPAALATPDAAPAPSDAPPVPTPTSAGEPAPTPLLLLMRLEEVCIESDARAQLRAWLAAQPQP